MVDQALEVVVGVVVLFVDVAVNDHPVQSLVNQSSQKVQCFL